MIGPILAIDTAGPVVGAALLDGERARTWSARAGRGSDSVLMPAIADLLEGVDDLAGVAVTVGPGAFTGLRVGVASALGIAFARRLRVVAVSSLEARAMLVTAPEVIALLDARKSRFYAQRFDTQSGIPVACTEPVDAPISQVLTGAPCVVVGEGTEGAQAEIAAWGGTVGPSHSPAEHVARIAAHRFEMAVEPAEIALRYLRPADAKPQVKPA